MEIFLLIGPRFIQMGPMPRYDPSNASVHVYTFKDGLLSAVAHDLKLAVTRFSIEHEGGVVRARFDADSLRVVTPMKDGAPSSGLLPAALYGEIEKNAREAVLDARRFPQISYEGGELSGRLSLHGTTRQVQGVRRAQAIEFRVDVRDFDIKPFSAMLGSLKVKPEVLVSVAVG